jgi:hypothetical protein
MIKLRELTAYAARRRMSVLLLYPLASNSANDWPDIAFSVL